MKTSYFWQEDIIFLKVLIDEIKFGIHNKNIYKLEIKLSIEDILKTENKFKKKLFI